MAINVVDYMNKFQEESLAAIKQTQDASLKAMESFGSFAKVWNEKPGTVPAFEKVPTPTQLVEMTFGFASQMLEIRKNYTMKIAEMIVETQKQADAFVNGTSQSTAHSAPTASSAPVNKQPVR